MTEFESFIFEHQPAKSKTLIWWIIGGLISLRFITIAWDVATFWSSILLIVLPTFLLIFIRFRRIDFGAHQDLMGFFTDELTINIHEIIIGINSIPFDRIKTLSIIYNNIYGTKRHSPIIGTSRLNGETNALKIEFNDNKSIQYYFRLKSIEQAKQLFELTDF